MDYKELENAVSVLQETTYRLEERYVENEGEVTEETEQMEAEIEALKFLLNGEGVDFLGRWLKSKEDRVKALKAEKDYISRQIESVDKTISFIKGKIRQLMDATGCERVKGEYGYSFSTYDSVKTEVDKAMLNEWYMKDIENALAEMGIPNWVTVTLGAKVSDVPDDEELPICFKVTETPNIRFTKPRAKKED